MVKMGVGDSKTRAGDSKYVVLFENGSLGGPKWMTMLENAKMGASG